MQVQGSMYPRQMERAVHQQQPQSMQGNRQAVASRAYHLEPINPLQLRQQGGSMPGMIMQQPGGGMMDGLSAYGPRPMVRGVQDGHMGPPPADVARAAGDGTQGIYGNCSMSYGDAGMGGVHKLQNGHAVLLTAGCAGQASDWNNINFNGIFDSAVNPQVQSSVAVQDDCKPLPFPPGNLLAQYPPEYQQQLICYYRLLRLQYPELYQQYVDYYVMYYEPLYHPAPSSLSKDNLDAKQPRKKDSLLPKTQWAHMQPQQPVTQQPVYQPPPPMEPVPQMEHALPPESMGRTTSNLSRGMKRQSSLRRQNSMRRNEVNQLKNEGSLKRLPSMRQQ